MNKFLKPVPIVALTILFSFSTRSQSRYELNSGWKCLNVSEVQASGSEISRPDFSTGNWMPAVVPGTVLTTLLENKKVPDPFYGLNNEKIEDIYHIGKELYTYWFVKDFNEKYPGKGEQVWLHFRGVNYGCDIFLNGEKLNPTTHKGMFLRQTYNITRLLNKAGNNRLAVIVYPPDHVGNPNGGQGGDGAIGRNVAHQYVAGWDWIQPIRDRNTGIWDKVLIEKTKTVNLKDPHVVTQVPGKRMPGVQQTPATVKTSVEIENPTEKNITGTVNVYLGDQKISKTVEVKAHGSEMVNLPDIMLNNPKLWWPHGYGKQHLYDLKFEFVTEGGEISDEENLKMGIREIQRHWNERTRSMQILVNGQPVFIKGGNWIISDAMLRLSPERYDAEVRFHRDMNLNLIRIWGGALAERPEFYQACDKYGLLVMQDFWMSGDCNGRWLDPLKKDDQWTRRQYPDDHQLFLTSAADMIKMIRNHPSLALWCGGNEITPPDDILIPLKEEILPGLDGTRWFIDYSNSDSMSFNFIGGNGDGPYGIQPISRFWEEQTFPFNSEVGSVGAGDFESLLRFIPEENLVAPRYPGKPDPVWEYHKYIGYDQHINPYGQAKNAKDFADKAQLVNYDQYRALAEGFSAHMWDWYTGFIIWKTQNPWTALRGQMYDYYLDPNAGLYGLKSGSEPLHIMCNAVDGMVMVVNNSFAPQRDLMLRMEAYDMAGNDSLITQVFTYLEPSSAKKILSVKEVMEKVGAEEGMFLRLKIMNINKEVLSENFYWFPDADGNYSGLQTLKKVNLQLGARKTGEGNYEVELVNPAGNPVAFFIRASLVDPETKKRILPTFYSDNYVSIVPGDKKRITLECPAELGTKPLISIRGWNVEETFLETEQ